MRSTRGARRVRRNVEQGSAERGAGARLRDATVEPIKARRFECRSMRVTGGQIPEGPSSAPRRAPVSGDATAKTRKAADGVRPISSDGRSAAAGLRTGEWIAVQRTREIVEINVLVNGRAVRLPEDGTAPTGRPFDL